MAEENGKPRSAGEVDQGTEVEPTMRALEREALELGPWTDDDERHFQMMVREFGGAAD